MTMATPDLSPIITSTKLNELAPDSYVPLNALSDQENRHIIIGENDTSISKLLPKFPLGIHKDSSGNVLIIPREKHTLIFPKYVMWLGLNENQQALETPSPALLLTPVVGEQGKWCVDASTKIIGAKALEHFTNTVAAIGIKKQRLLVAA